MSAKRLRHKEYLGTGNNGGTSTFTVPPNVHRIWVWGYGGGGGGGGGRGGASANTTFNSPGGGGGGGSHAPPAPIVLDVTPGETLDTSVGAGGTGGPGGSGNAGFGSYGNNGGDTTISRSGSVVIRFAGAHGGVGGGNQAADNPGGAGPVHTDTSLGDGTYDATEGFTEFAWGTTAPSAGGWGCSKGGAPATAMFGQRNFTQRRTSSGSNTRSIGGTPNGTDGTGKGGGAGGGGGNGPGGIGGDGGAGGNSGLQGASGLSAGPSGTAANTGAGGGGGGAAGYQGSAGGAGGDGGSGRLIISWIA